MGKSLIIPGADFSANAVYKNQDIMYLLAPNSSATVTFNIPGQSYNPNQLYDGCTVVTLTNPDSEDKWVGLNVADHVDTLNGAAGIFSKQAGYVDNTAIKKIRCNIELPSFPAFGIFAPIYNFNNSYNLKEMYWGPGEAPTNCFCTTLDYVDFSRVTKIINRKIFTTGGPKVVNMSNCTISSTLAGSATSLFSTSPDKIIINNMLEDDITRLINYQSAVTYNRTTDEDGDVLIKVV